MREPPGWAVRKSLQPVALAAAVVVRMVVGLSLAVGFASAADANCDPLDGDVKFAEECDDGNLVEEDACTTDCTWNVCGDGLVCSDKATAGSSCGSDGPTVEE